MHIHMDLSGTLPGFERSLEAVTRDGNIQGVLVLACAANDFPIFEMNLILKTRPYTIFGGIFPSIIFGTRRFERGTILVGISRAVRAIPLEGLSDAGMSLETVLASAAVDSEAMKTLMVFVDSSSKRIGFLVDSLGDIFGVKIGCLGGGAGSLTMQPKPCLFSNEGLLEDAAILALLDLEIGIGVSHGWEPVIGPYRVTESRGNVIKTLDWKPAFEVYRNAVETHSRRTFEEEGFWGMAKNYPFGITKMAIERVVRDPLEPSPDGSLTCMGAVPEGVFVDILHGRADDLITAAGRACGLAGLAFHGSAQRRITLLMDCISRVEFLGNRFREEIQAIHQDRQPMLGACTIGQIAGSGKDSFEFHNKTTVVGILERP
jgi:hypothetical protein